MKANGKNRTSFSSSSSSWSLSEIETNEPRRSFRKRLILDGKVTGFGTRYDTLEQLVKEAKQLGHLNERKYEEVDK